MNSFVERHRKQQTLPRHTNLATLTRRSGAFFIDLAICALITIIFSVFVFQNVFASTMNKKQATLYEYDFNSHLFVYDENTKERKTISSSDNYLVYRDALEYYYLHYLTGVDPDIPVGTSQPPEHFIAPNYQENVPGTDILPKDYFTVQFFNEKILEITDHSDDETSASYFKYDVDEYGNVDKTKIGVRREKHFSSDAGHVVDVPMKETCDVMHDIYYDTYVGHLCQQNFYKPLLDQLSLLSGICWLFSIIIAVIAVYIIVPLFTTNYASPGKAIFKIGLANIDGFVMHKYQLIFRAIPVIITAAAIFLIPFPSAYISFSIVLVMLMASVGLAAASPKRCSIHDYCGRTIVIDTPTSIIFTDSIDEEEFVQAEDGLAEEL